MDTDLIAQIVITGGVSVVTFASGFDVPIGIALSETSLTVSFAAAIIQKYLL